MSDGKESVGIKIQGNIKKLDVSGNTVVGFDRASDIQANADSAIVKGNIHIAPVAVKRPKSAWGTSLTNAAIAIACAVVAAGIVYYLGWS